MDIPIKINGDYTISKDTILEKYKSLDNYFMMCLQALYGENNTIDIACFLPTNIINDNGNNNLSVLDSLKGKTGVYVFLDNNSIPVYIGKGGTSKRIGKDIKDLKFRIGQEFGSDNGHNTLSNNIIAIDSLLENKTVSPDDSLEKIKSFSLLTISMDRCSDNEIIKDNLDKTTSLETILIALFHPKYNK